MTEQTEQAPQNLIQVKSVKSGRTVEFEKSLGLNLAEAISLVGEDVVFNLYEQQAVIKCQSIVRTLLDKGASTADAIAAGQNYVPGVTRRARVVIDPISQLVAMVASKKTTLEELKAQLEAQLAALQGVET